MTTNETRQRIEAIKKRIEKATEGPWRAHKKGDPLGNLIAATAPGQQIHSDNVGGVSPLFNQEFIAPSREDLHWLLLLYESTAARLEKAIKAWEKARAFLKETGK